MTDIVPLPAAPSLVRCDACRTWVAAKELHICTAGMHSVDMNSYDYGTKPLDIALRNARQGWTLLPSEATALHNEIVRLRRVADAAVLYLDISPYDDLEDRRTALESAVALYKAGE